MIWIKSLTNWAETRHSQKFVSRGGVSRKFADQRISGMGLTYIK
ncbi:hypothetical protein Z950_459 [Sulfitobacter mediterraneus KCTC 32188]|nr:hypothetical protein Z950_459 [Sulfitobacter mediterraneus KCTC 32188]